MKQTIIAIIFSTFIFSCKETGESVNISNKHSNERINATLVVNTPVSLSGVTYDVIEIHAGGSVTFTNGINNVTEIKNLIPSNGKAVINVNSSASLVSNKILFGNTDFNNYGTTIITGYIKSTNASAFFNNVGQFYYSDGATYLEWNAGTFRNSGNMSMTGANTYYPLLQLNGGNFQFLNCGKLFVQTFNNNANYAVSGTGYIRVYATLQLNGYLTSSPSIKICQTTYPVGSAAFGNAVRACDNSNCPIIEY